MRKKEVIGMKRISREDSMENKFYQACYTRVGVHEGWRSINLSDDIPQNMLSMFERNEAGNEVKKGIPTDKNGIPLWMFEIFCNKDCIGIVRVQYGLSDAFGRSNFFSHGFLFPNAYELLKNPNNILGISDYNFKTDIEKTKIIEDNLERVEDLNIKHALETCHMTRANYVRYIQCVYYALSTNTKNTIYVYTDGEDDTVRNLLYLTYSAIPYSLRLKITASTCPEIDGTNKMLVFCTKIPEYTYFVNPRSGENNILTAAIERRWARNPFVSYFAENYQSVKQNEETYQNMEKWLGEMGDVLLRDMDSLRLAYSMCRLKQDEIDDEELQGLLYDWLALPVQSCESFEKNIAYFLELVVERQIKLNEESEQLLRTRIKEGAIKQLQDVYLRYYSFAIVQMGHEEGCDCLRGLGKETPIFAKLRELLMNSKEGMGLLCEYYVENTKRIVKNPECTYGDLVETYYDCIDLDDIIKDVQTCLHKKNIEISKKKLQENEDIREVLRCYKETEIDIGNKQFVLKPLYDEYDRLAQIDFRPEKISEYKKFYSKHKEYSLMRSFLKGLNALEQEKYEWIELYLNSEKAEELSPQLIDSLFECALKNNAAEQCLSITFWDAFAEKKKMPLAELLINNHIKILYDSDVLENSLKEDLEFWDTTETVEGFYETCLQCMEQEGGCKEALNESCEILKYEVKQRKAEDKRHQKELNQKEKRVGKRGNKIMDFLGAGNKIYIEEPEEVFEEYSPYEEIGETVQEQAKITKKSKKKRFFKWGKDD